MTAIPPHPHVFPNPFRLDYPRLIADTSSIASVITDPRSNQENRTLAPRIVPPALKAIEQETMADKVYRQLREALMSGRFAPGQALSLRSVAEAVGSSTMPVRAAG